MINKEALAQFIYKTCVSDEKFFIQEKKFGKITTMCIEERGWINAQIFLTNCYYIEKFVLVGIIYKHAKFGF